MKIELYNWQNQKKKIIPLKEAFQLSFSKFVGNTTSVLNEAENKVIYGIFSVEKEGYLFSIYQNSVTGDSIAHFTSLTEALDKFIKLVKKNPSTYWYLTQLNSELGEVPILIYPKGALS